MSARKSNLMPIVVLVATLLTPMAVVIPSIGGPAVEGWEPPAWWEIAQFWFLSGFISVHHLEFVPWWGLLQLADDWSSPFERLLASFALNDMLAYLTLSLSCLFIGLMLCINTVNFSHGERAFRSALAITMLLLFVEFILPSLVLLNLFRLAVWSATAVIPTPFPGIIAGLAIIREHRQRV